MVIIDQIRKRELNTLDPECFFRDQCVTKPLVDSLTHSYTLHGHAGCVNTINWNAAGTLLASGSDDQHVFVWREDGRLVQRLNTAHTNNIFSVLFIPHARDHLIVSASGDAQVLLHDLEQQPSSTAASDEGDQHRHLQRWECGGRVKKLVTCAAEPRLFWSTSEDGVLRQYDLRDNHTVDLLTMGNEYQLKSLAINEARPEMIAVGLSDAMVPIYDRRNMKQPVFRLLPSSLYLCNEGRFLSTHLAFNKRGNELIVNISSDNIYIFDVVSDPNRNGSPDVLSTLKNFLSDDSKIVPWRQERNGTIPISSQHLQNANERLLFEEISLIENTQELSERIDKCSQFLACHWGRGFIQRLVFLSTLVDKVAVQQQYAQLKHPNVFLHCLSTRACCLFERNWDGDQFDSIRDCLIVLRISPKHKPAHFLLIKSLVALKQLPLATDCFTSYYNLYQSDEKTAELELMLNEKKNEEGEKLWTPEYNANHRDYVQRYTGHLNINTDIKESNWFGPNDQYIVAGSDCGSMFIWERNTQCVVKAFKGDHYTVNCCQPHPQRCLIATSGIDNVIRFWEPASTDLKKATEEGFPEEAEGRNITELYELMKRNRRVRTPELVWEHLLNSVGLGLFQVDSTHEEDETGREENEEDETEGTHVIRCRQM